MGKSLVSAAALGHGPADKRMEILHLVGRHGSISQAARSAVILKRAAANPAAKAWMALMRSPNTQDFIRSYGYEVK